jgi:hypothetical protein
LRISSLDYVSYSRFGFLRDALLLNSPYLVLFVDASTVVVVDARNLSLGIWGGDVVLKDLQISPDALRGLNLPIAVKHGDVFAACATYFAQAPLFSTARCCFVGRRICRTQVSWASWS